MTQDFLDKSLAQCQLQQNEDTLEIVDEKEVISTDMNIKKQMDRN